MNEYFLDENSLENERTFSALVGNVRDLFQHSIQMKSMKVSPNLLTRKRLVERIFQQTFLSQLILSHYRISALTFQSRREKLSARRRLNEKLFHYLPLSAFRDGKSSLCCQKIIRRKISNSWAARRCNPHFGCVAKLVHKSFLLDKKSTQHTIDQREFHPVWINVSWVYYVTQEVTKGLNNWFVETSGWTVEKTNVKV